MNITVLADPRNWPQYAVVNLRSESPGEDGWFNALTKFGEGKIKVNGAKKFGILDHTWKVPQATWDAYCRAVPNGESSLPLP